MGHPNEEVRKKAMDLIVNIYIIMGEVKLRPHL